MALRAAQQFETVKRLSELCPSNVAFPMSQLPPFHLLCALPPSPPRPCRTAPPTTTTTNTATTLRHFLARSRSLFILSYGSSGYSRIAQQLCSQHKKRFFFVVVTRNKKCYTPRKRRKTSGAMNSIVALHRSRYICGLKFAICFWRSL